MAYDINKRQEFMGRTTVRDIINILNTLNPDATFLCDGDSYFYLHVESDDSIVCIDSSSLDDDYPDPEDDGEEDDPDPDSDAHMKRIW